jgi:hypothetical protein
MEKLNPEKIVKMLRLKGIDISIEQATDILSFLKKLSNIIVSDYLNSNKTKK